MVFTMLHMLHGVIRAMQQSISLSGMFTLCIQEFCCDLFVFVYRLVLAEHTCAVAQGLSGKYVFRRNVVLQLQHVCSSDASMSTRE